jgi:hypothetical protein
MTNKGGYQVLLGAYPLRKHPIDYIICWKTQSSVGWNWILA